MTRKLIWLRWVDAAFVGKEWRRVDSLKDYCGFMMETAGFLVKESKEGYYIAADTDPEETERFRYICFVPRGMVRKKRVVKIEV